MRNNSLNRSILKLAIPNIISNITVPLLGFVDMVLMGHQDSIAYIGATAARAIRNTMLISAIGVFLPATLLLMPHFGNHGLWVAFLLFMVARGLSMTLMAKKAVFQ